MRHFGNGTYSAYLDENGAGYSTWHDYLLTGWSGDPTENPGGVFVYCSEGGRIVGGEVSVAPGQDVEVRRLRLRNQSAEARRIEVTSYIEVVLNQAAAHAVHPAFSKLFVETELAEGMLLAHRRPRSNSEHHPWLLHAMSGAGPLECETDRARFLGRGRSPFSPAMAMSGSVGSVLDPVFALRRGFQLGPGEETEVVLVLACAMHRDAALALGARVGPAQPAGSGHPISTTPACIALPATAIRPAAPALRVRHHFSDDGDEYVVHVHPSRGVLPPMPWTNTVSNEHFGFIVSETGAAYTWSQNSRENRLTPWYNDPVRDPHGEALYLRDESGACWSPLPGPRPADAEYEVRHGIGYSRWTHTRHDLEQEVTLFVPRHEPVKLTRVRLTNRGQAVRKFSLYSYSRLVLGILPEESGRTVITNYDAESGALFARNPANNEFAGAIVFASLGPRAARPQQVRQDLSSFSFTANRTTFLGPGGSPAEPAAVLAGDPLDGHTGADLDPCAALKLDLELAPGETREITLLLGEATDEAAARALVERYSTPAAVEDSLHEVRSFWQATLGAVRVQTPSPAIDRMTSGWLLYQIISCRLFGRSAYYQSGGAFGFRDQLQDAAALVLTHPWMTRAQIVLHAGHQFVEGDVLHWWHPPTNRGIRTRFADDLNWLPWVTAGYIHTTGDWSVLDESAPFLTARALEPGEDEALLFPVESDETADVYEHCCRALDRSLTKGAHGLPLFGTGDWNDGMNRVGREGRGESVWMAFFLHRVLADFTPACKRRGDDVRLARYRAYQKDLENALDDAAWDGDWYRRAYYDDGTPLGSKENTECRIDALAQAWSVISEAVPRARAERAMDSVEEMLVDREAGLIRLLAPPFDRDPHDPGYIKGYVPGIRENGGQYTHGAVWVVQATAELGRRDRAAAYLEMLTPVHHARNLDVYQVEPYVVAADIYGVPPHVGRGGWTWYTGSAGWMFRVALGSILGLRVERGDTLVIAPCIPDEWPGFTAQLRLFGGKLACDVEVRNPDRCSARVLSVEVDGAPASTRIQVPLDGIPRHVVVTLGRAG